MSNTPATSCPEKPDNHSRQSVDDDQDQTVGNVQSKALFQCSHCKRVFNRAHHLSRHVKIHTLEKPYVCTVCSKAFSRADLLKRHCCRHLSPRRMKKNGVGGGEARARVARACSSCAMSKVKCGGEKPCRRCQLKKLFCDYPDPPAVAVERPGESIRGQRNVMDDISDNLRQQNNTLLAETSPSRDSHRQDDPSQLHRLSLPRNGYLVDNSLSYTVPYPRLLSDQVEIGGQTAGTNQPLLVGDSSSNSSPQTCRSNIFSKNSTVQDQRPSMAIPDTMANHKDAVDSYAAFLKDLLAPQEPNQLNLVPVTIEPYDMWDSLMNASYDWNYDLDAIQDGSSEFAMAASGGSYPPSRSELPEQEALLSGVKAFKSSFWNWVPSPEDTGVGQEFDLSLPEGSGAITQTVHSPDSIMFEKELTSASRDRVLGLLTSFCERKNISRIIAFFPSSVLMQGLVPLALRYLASDPLNSIHVPTLALHSISADLLAMLVAYGASLTPIPAVQKLGYAIPELIRKSVVKQWDQDNSKTRNLEYIQAFALTNFLFLWSGSKRRMEIAESFTQPLVTILRRSGMMRKDHYVNIVVDPADETQELEDKWRLWVEQETKKRLVHQLFVYDSQVSMSNFTSPLMNCAEMVIPIPQPDSLWLASTAQVWKSRILANAQSSDRVTSVAHLTRIVLSGDFRPQASKWTYESTLASYAMWRFVWQGRVEQDIFEIDTFSGDRFGLYRSAERDSLRRLLSDWASLEYDEQQTYVEPAFLRAFLCMTAYVPLQAVQSFCGKYGEAEAHRVFPMLQEWTITRDARVGMWAAAHVLHIASQLPPGTLRDFHAVIVYQASMALYAYAAIMAARQKRLSQASSTLPSLAPGNGTDVVWLGYHDLYHVRNFINLGEGSPVLGDILDEFGPNGPYSLLSPGAIMESSVRLLSKQGQAGGTSLPPLVENLTQLMTGIGGAASAAGLG